VIAILDGGRTLKPGFSVEREESGEFAGEDVTEFVLVLR
jgi:hypothetical protein